MIKKVRRPSKKLLEKWHDMTDNNEHAEVRIEIAKYFGDTLNPTSYETPFGFEDAFKEIKQARSFDKEGLQILITSNLLTKLMLERIFMVYGYNVYNAVNDCL